MKEQIRNIPSIAPEGEGGEEIIDLQAMIKGF
jgi:hypothetical protein